MSIGNYNGLEVPSGTPSGTGGVALSNNFKLLADSYATDNVLHNADFNLFQRQVPGTLTAFSSLGYTADRWWAYCETGSCQAAQVAGYTGSQNGLEIKNTTTLQGVMIGQWVESFQSVNFQSTTVRFQIWVKSSSAQTVQLNVYEWQGTADAPAYTSGKFSVTSHVITYSGTSIASDASTTLSLSANTWTSVYVEAAVTSSANNIAVAVQAPIAATTGTLIVSQAQLLPASTTATNGISKWVPIPYQLDLANCQRFFSTNCPLGSSPSGTPTVDRVWTGSPKTRSINWISDSYPVTMRASPTITLYGATQGGSGNWAFWSYSAASWISVATSANSVYVSNSNSFTINCVYAGQGDSPYPWNGCWTASADL